MAAGLISQGLGGLWYERLSHVDLDDETPSSLLADLKRHRLELAGLCLAQSRAVRKLRALFDGNDIAHAVFKGAHIRELVYDEPALRPATDLDVLVKYDERRWAIALLQEAGFSLRADKRNASHEVTLAKDGIYIDLHWDLMRPGRTRAPLAERFLATRRDFGSHWGPDEHATLFLMLVHPVITKYLTTPHASLVRVLDLFWWLERMPVDWDAVLDWLDRAGLRAAAWLSLEWAGRFGELPVPGDFRRAVAPGRLRQRYLRYWLDHNLPTRLLQRQWLVQLGFTLPVHDRASDAWRVVRQARRARRGAAQELAGLVSKDGA